MHALKGFKKQDCGLGDLLNYATLIAEGIILNKDGSLMAGFFYRGPDSSNLTYTQRNAMSAKINAILARLGSGFVTHHDVIRVPAQGYSSPASSFFPDPITKLIDEERRQQFNQTQRYYKSVYAFTLTYLPPLQMQNKLNSFIFSSNEKMHQDLTNKHLDFFEKTLIEIEDNLSNLIFLERMRTQKSMDEFGQEHSQDELIQYLHGIISGEHHPIDTPPCPMYLDAVIGGHEFYTGIRPKMGNKFISVVSIEGFPQTAVPNMLNILDKLPVAYRWSTRFIYLDAQDALVHLNKYRRKWQQKIRGFSDQLFRTQKSAVDQDAIDMVCETESAIAEANSNLVIYGYYTSVVVLMSESIEDLTEHARLLSLSIQKLGFLARIETVNTLEAWRGSLPSNTQENVRIPLMHTMNLSHLLPLSSVWAGHDVSPCPFYPKNSPPLMQVATEGSTPLKINLHVGDLGHTLVFGPTGSGKSTLLGFIIAQFFRYPKANVFAFDKGNSLFALTQACGGAHYEIAAEESHLAFCPFAHMDSDSEQAWAENWVETLVALQGVSVTSGQRVAIHQAMGLLRSAKVGRTLTDFATNLQDHTLRDALSYYTINGVMGDLLDAEQDGLTYNPFQVFEMEHIMNLGEKILLPVLLYLFHRIEKQLNGQPALLVLDEAWLMLGHPVFREKIREWLKVMRKANCAVILATQSLSDASRSGILDVLQESCPTKIFLPNEEAHHSGIREVYYAFGLNERQVDIVASSTKKRDYYLFSPEGQRLFELALGPVAKAFVTVSSKKEIEAMRQLIQQHGEQWTTFWLAQRGITQ